jgi:nitroreductase
MKYKWFYIGYGLNWLRQSLRRKPRRSVAPQEVVMTHQALDWIFGRRSIRRFHSNPVEEEKVRRILEAAMAAPSANNAQPWHFIVVTERETLNRIAEVHPYAKMCYEATLVIAVCGDPVISPHYWPQDCSAATQNILLAGTALGLGTVWLGVHPRDERKQPLKQLLGAPDDKEILSLVALGYPAEKKQSRTQFDPGRVHYKDW